MTRISTHVLDTAHGRPAVGVPVELHRREGDDWILVTTSQTDVDGRVTDLAENLSGGHYRLVLKPGSDLSPLYPEIHLVVLLDDSEPHYHLPVLLSPYGYTTYRGS